MNKCNSNILKFTCKWLLNIFLAAGSLYVSWLLLQLLCFTYFRVPGNSMSPTLIPGDNILVEKWTLGARFFNILDAVNGHKINIYRTSAFGKIKRNDVLVFNFPYPEKWDSIGFDIMKYYVKRCVALPGDTFSIQNGINIVNGCTETLGNIQGQLKIADMFMDEQKHAVMSSVYPKSDTILWTIRNFGPLYIPKKGAIINLDSYSAILYRNIIEWEQEQKLSIKNDEFFLGDSLITSYRFGMNYYFVAGDNVINSEDSRYWGLLPESYIVGKAIRVLYSVNPLNKKNNWSRTFKMIE